MLVLASLVFIHVLILRNFEMMVMTKYDFVGIITCDAS